LNKARAAKVHVRFNKIRSPRKRRRLRISSPPSLRLPSIETKKHNEQFRFSDVLPSVLDIKRVNNLKAKSSSKKPKNSSRIEKKNNSEKKASCSFRRWSVLLCTIDKQSKTRNKLKNQIKDTRVDLKDSKLVKKRVLTVVRARPCARNRMPCDRRKMRKIHLFDPSKDRSKAKRASEGMLIRAKRKVLKEINRQQDLGRDKPSPLEQAFFDATNENCLSFDYQRMKMLVRGARFCNSSEQKVFRADDDAYNDNVNVILNSKISFVESELCITLFHECLHNTVERSGKPGNPQLSAEHEHIAMALLGDREEQQEYFEKYFNMDYVNESWLKVAQRKKRRRNPKYLTNVYEYE